jgi:hypothetical protein
VGGKKIKFPQWVFQEAGVLPDVADIPLTLTDSPSRGEFQYKPSSINQR